MNSLFHAYVVGGARENARTYIETLLSKHGVVLHANPDYLLIERVSFSVEDARAIRSWQELAPLGEKKVLILYTDFITGEAQNALLKTFEEPVADTHIFFAVPNPDILLPTLLSRVQIIVPPVNAGAEDNEEAKKFLKMKIGERMSFIQKLAEKSEDEDASAQVRERAVGFLNDLEFLLAKDIVKNQKKLDELIRLKKYLYMPGSSVKMILETIALTVDSKN